jgi:hypothetical protein
MFKIINTKNRTFKKEVFKTLKGAERFCEKVNRANDTSATICNYYKIIKID